MRGKVWVVGCLLVVGFSVGVLAGPLSGQWSVWGRFEYDAAEAIMLVDYGSLLQIDYTTCGWTFTGSALFGKDWVTVGGPLGAISFYSDRFKYLWFTAGGSLGAIDFYSALTFGVPGFCGFVLTSAPLGIDTMDTNGTTLPMMGFLSWISSARMSIAGLDLFAIFAVLKEYTLIDNFNHALEFSPKNTNGHIFDFTMGSGLILGGSGSAGDCDICVQVGFNLWRQRRGAVAGVCVCHYGWDWVLPFFAPIHCCDGWVGPDCMWRIEDPTCSLCFSWASIYLEQSFACFDLMVDVLFSFDYGFDAVNFTICDICLGLPWLELGTLQVSFAHEHHNGDSGGYQKQVWGDFDLILADCICFTPYLVLDVDHFFELDSIGLAALTVEYDIGQGVTFKAGHLFFRYASWLDWQDCQSVWFRAFTETGDVAMWTDDMYCRPCLMPWDEYIGFMIDGDSCCGGQFDVWIFTWFNGGGGMTQIDPPSLSALNPMAVNPTSPFMDWAETRIKLDVGIGTNVALMFKVSLTAQGLNWFELGAETRW